MGGNEAVVDSGGRRNDALLHEFTAHVPEVFETLHGDTVNVLLVRQHRDVFIQPYVRQFPGEELLQPGIVLGRRCSQNPVVVNPWWIRPRHPTQAVYPSTSSLGGSPPSRC